MGEAPAPGTEPPAELPAAAATVALPPAPEAAGALPPGPEAPRALAPGPAEPLALPPGPAEPLALPPAPESAGPTSAGAGGEAGLPGALAELQTATGARISGSDVAGGEGWKLVTARKGDEFEAFGEPGKTSFRWLACVPEANWEWAERRNQLVPTWYTGKEGTPAVLVRYRVRLNEDVTAAMSKVADQPGALERLGPAKFQYFLPAGFEHHATVERIEVVKVLLPPR